MTRPTKMKAKTRMMMMMTLDTHWLRAGAWHNVRALSIGYRRLKFVPSGLPDDTVC